MRDLGAELRGSLRYDAIDARRVTIAAKNTSCLRLRAIVISGIDPNAVARRVFRLPGNPEQSGFALRQGNTFERAQSRNGAARLLQALRQAEILGPKDIHVLDLGRLPGSNSSSSAARTQAGQRGITETDRALRSKITRHVDAPNVILQAHLRLPLGDNGAGEEAVVRPDVLTARSGEAMYRVGDIKSFTALRHLTDEEDVANAAAQCGVYAIALEAALRRLGWSEAVPTEAVLVLRKSGGLNAKATLQRIGRDIEIARRVLDQRHSSLREVENILGPGQALDTAANVLRLPDNFMGACRSFCPLWQVCLHESRRQGAPSILGTDVEEALGALGSIQRARELMTGAIPANDLERNIQQRLLAYQNELREAAE